MTLPADIERYIERNFREDAQTLVRELLHSAVLHDGKPPGARLLRCALLSSRGSLDILRAQVEHIAVDYRDVILEGEYEPRGGNFVRVRDLNEPFAEDA